VTVQVRIPTILRSYTGGAAEVTAAEGTLREVIAGLDAAYPGLGSRIIDDGGKLRRFVNVYVGDEDVRFAQGLDTHVPAGERVSVGLTAVAWACRGWASCARSDGRGRRWRFLRHCGRHAEQHEHQHPSEPACVMEQTHV